MANEKSKAQEYRDERKARVAEAAKKNAKNMKKKNATKKIVKKVVSAVLVLAIVLGIAAAVPNYFGTWDRLIKAGGAAEGEDFTLAEFEYYYWSAYNTLLQEVSNSYSTGSNYNFDPSLPPDQQTTMAEDEKGNPISWTMFLRLQAIDQLEIDNAYYSEAVKNNFTTLSEADQKQIEDVVESWRQQAEGTATTGTAQGPKYSLNAYLRLTFGDYMNENFLRKILEKSLIIQNYQEHLAETIGAGYSAEEIKAEYEKDKDAYDMVDIRIYEFAKSTITSKEGESDADREKRQKESDAKMKKDAEDFLAAITDEASFIAKAEELNKDDEDYDGDKSTKLAGVLKANASSLSNDCATWLFDDETKAGDKKLFENKDATAYYVIYVIEGPHQVETVSVRHILFTTTDSTTGADLSEAEVEQKKKDAEATLAQWKENPTEDNFAALATEFTEDTGSAQNGGLYEAVCPGQMVAEFDEWIFAEGRKSGDTAIVKTDYGYHVMYFVSNDGQYYETTIREKLAATDVNAKLSEIATSEAYAVTYGPRRIEYAENKVNKHIEDYLAKQARQSSYSYF